MGIEQSSVTACLVTRGDRDLTPILNTLVFDNVIVWDNSVHEDRATYGRYLAAAQAATEFVYFQDDDVIVPPRTQKALLAHYQDGLLANMEAGRNVDNYERLAWVGWGAITHRAIPPAVFLKWSLAGGTLTSRAFDVVGCDILVGVLAPHTRVSFAHRHLDYAFGADRACQLEHFARWKDDFYNAAVALHDAH